MFRAVAAGRWFVLQDRESRAGERLRLAGYSSGRGDCARGGWSAGRCGFVAAFCVRLVTGGRFYWSVLRSITPVVPFLSQCFAFDHA